MAGYQVGNPCTANGLLINEMLVLDVCLICDYINDWREVEKEIDGKLETLLSVNIMVSCCRETLACNVV